MSKKGKRGCKSRERRGCCEGDGCGCGCRREGGCDCGCCRGCSCRGGFRRRYQTTAEKIAELEIYLKELEAEVQAVGERLADLKRKK